MPPLHCTVPHTQTASLMRSDNNWAQPGTTESVVRALKAHLHNEIFHGIYHGIDHGIFHDTPNVRHLHEKIWRIFLTNLTDQLILYRRIFHGIGGSRSTITLVRVPPSDIRVLPEQQARDKSKAKRKNL
jgi:hypothetical protein